jgi:hypothetical protein
VDWWIEKQLRSNLISELDSLIPENYFERDKDKFLLDKTIDNSGRLSEELRWGYLAGSVGKYLFFNNMLKMTSRQKSASEVLMNLGMLIAAKASQDCCLKVKNISSQEEINEGNVNIVAEQLSSDHIPTLTKNVNSSLTQYIRHLSMDEAKPLLPLLSKRDLIKLGFKTSKWIIILLWLRDNIIGISLAPILTAIILHQLDLL